LNIDLNLYINGKEESRAWFYMYVWRNNYMKTKLRDEKGLSTLRDLWDLTRSGYKR